MPDEAIERLDINIWYRNHEICPTCGVNLRGMHPMMNLLPHWEGTCNRITESEPGDWDADEREDS